MTANAPSPSLSLTVQGIKPKKGTWGILRVAVFASPDGFPDQADKAVAQRSIDLDARVKSSGEQPEVLTVTEEFTGLGPPSSYAISVLQDLNGNGTLDTNFLGIPNEGIGFSGNPSIWRGAPDYAQCAIKAEPGKTSAQVVMVYLL